jgi:hypothetical protein
VLLIATAAVGVASGLVIHDLQKPAAPKPGWRDSGGGFGADVIACATPSWCVGLESSAGQNAEMTWSSGHWAAAVSLPPDENYVSLSCPAVGNCLGLTSNGLTLHLANGTWGLGEAYDRGVTGPAYASPSAILSCSSIDSCVAVNGGGDEVTLGPDGWSRVESIDDAPLTGLSCPSPSACVAADGDGRVLISLNDAFGVPRKVAPDAIQAVACASGDFCAVADLDGNVRVGNPDQLGPPHRLGSSAQPLSLACPSVGVCIAAGPNGGISVFANDHWQVVTFAGTSSPASVESEAVSCAVDTSDFCAIADGVGDVEFGGAPFT